MRQRTVFTRLVEAGQTFLSRSRRNGVLDAGKWLFLHYFHWRYREWRLGIHTAGFIAQEQLSRDPNCLAYEPCNYPLIDAAISLVPRPLERHALLDYGCGKGRAVIVAATWPFQRVIGLEHSEQLCELARQNLKSARRRLACCQVDVLQGDAATYEVPADVSVVFLFNPFVGNVLQSALAQLRRSYERDRRAMLIFYLHITSESNLLAKQSWLVEHARLSSGERENMTYRMYATAEHRITE